MIRIVSKKDGFRRAGVAHAGTCDYPDGRFTPQQLAMLKGEPLLVVEEFADAKPTKQSEKPEKPESA